MEVFLTPNWFFGYEFIIDTISVIIASLIAYFSWKIYKLTDSDQPRLFSFAFILIAISYFVQFVLNELILLYSDDALSLKQYLTVVHLNQIGIVVSLAFFISGLVTLVYMTAGIKSKKIYSLLILLSALFIILNVHDIHNFFLLTSILLGYLLIHYFFNFVKHKHFKNFIVLSGFALFLAASLNYFYAPQSLGCFITANFLELGALILLLLNLGLVVKK